MFVIFAVEQVLYLIIQIHYFSFPENTRHVHNHSFAFVYCEKRLVKNLYAYFQRSD